MIGLAELLVEGLHARHDRAAHARGLGADAIEFVLDNEPELTAWERDFARSLRRQRSAISTKQIAILDQILEKVRRAAARAA